MDDAARRLEQDRVDIPGSPLPAPVLYESGGRPPDVSIDPPRSYTRAEADRMFLEIMKAEEVAWWRRWLAYTAVRVFGRGAWRGRATARRLRASRLRREVGMFARVHTLETGPEEYERGYQMVRDVLLPWARESTGFCGLIGLVDEDRKESLVITLWADEESAEASASAGDSLGDLAATASGATRSSLKSYAVSIFDVPAQRPSHLPEPLGGERARPPQVH